MNIYTTLYIYYIVNNNNNKMIIIIMMMIMIGTVRVYVTFVCVHL